MALIVPPAGPAACHRCHDSGGSHVAMQGIENPDNFGIEFRLLKKNPFRVSAAK
ncbi:hypothetical protein IVA95_37410 [Bradyrhizobium sp. 157]|uniref:hypothetical protein n=1 Tax=Bradyrhizobium sp. 157 TaxID=2782631 RepID=UPI001FFA0C6D|nr:hypothetical protein [Bradyrhizobium sp. 157]MCK1643089.1 hypothetical protein [Bradyrhizobium sp. 157]